MNRHRKVFWSEGMLLMPHHFQQLDKYHEWLLNSRIEAQGPYGWGLLDLQVNENELAKGRFAIERCRAVMDDGLLIDIPYADDPPTPPTAQEIESLFVPVDRIIDVYLAVPDMSSVKFKDGETSLRYRKESCDVADETDKDNWQQLDFACKNLRLLFANEPRTGYRTIRIARLKKSSTGPTEGCQLVASYIPPCLHINLTPQSESSEKTKASWLMENVLTKLIAELTLKSKELSKKRSEVGGGRAAFSTRDVTTFWQLHSVNAALPVLHHLSRVPLVHPERLYTEMARLAGALMTLSEINRPSEIAQYDHYNLSETFGRLYDQIIQLLTLATPTDYVEVDLEDNGEGYYFGDIKCEWPLDEAAFFVGVYVTGDRINLTDDVLRYVKIAAQSAVKGKVGKNSPGLPLKEADAEGPSSQFTKRHRYFELLKTATQLPRKSSGTTGYDEMSTQPRLLSQEDIDDLWKPIYVDRKIGVFAPGVFPGIELKMYICKGNK